MLQLLLHYKYIAFFIGMILGGDLVLITGVFLATQNIMDIRWLIVLAISATLLSDLCWFYIGKHFPQRTLLKWNFIKRRQALIDKISNFFKKHSFKTVFYSKFIYGTRTIVQLMSGGHRLSVSKFFAVDAVGTIGYTLLIVALGYSLRLGIEDVEEVVHSAQITFAIFVVVLFAINIAIQKGAKKILE